jgi:uncharacterized protein
MGDDGPPTIAVPIPQPDRDTAPYWQALAEGRLVLQRCADCGRWTWPARPICSGCFGFALVWEGAAGTGEVYSWIVTYQPYSAALAAIVPYVVALVRIDEQDDIMIPGRFASDAEIHQGMRVRMATEKASDDIGILDWVPA